MSTYVYKDVSSKDPAQYKLVAEIEAELLSDADAILLKDYGINAMKTPHVVVNLKQTTTKQT